MLNNKFKKIFSLGLVSIFLFSTLSACSQLETKNRRLNSVKDGSSITLYAAVDSGADTVTALFMRDFAKRVEEKSNGKIKVETYSDSQVGNDGELLEAVKNGNISFVFQTTAPQVTLIPQAAILDAPMAFKNKEIARKVLDGKLLEHLKPYYSEKNIELLAFADQGFREMTSNKKINSFADFNNIKIRTMENSNHILFWKNLGANPTPMAYSEVYIGLQQGIITAQENPLEAIIVPRFYEQQDYMILTNHIIHSIAAIASKDVMDSLNQEQKTIIYEAINESKIWARNKTDERLSMRTKTIKDSGTEIIEISDETYKRMQEAAKPVWDKIENSIGSDLVNILKEEIEKHEK